MKNGTKDTAASHPTDVMLADYLDGLLSCEERRSVERHLSACAECLNKAVSAYRSVKQFKKRKAKTVGKINFYLLFAILAFALSFILPRHFIQLLVATLLLGAKWVADSKSTKMLVMIHEAWKNGGKDEASEVIKRFDSRMKTRL
ncbi:MAG: zf-HC2 domain-containing protein [Candidatus Omnitrophica bacterium]|nr:zf-HC2 domain-containing protein [Candidatus Omnitrophota bacterium]